MVAAGSHPPSFLGATDEFFSIIGFAYYAKLHPHCKALNCNLYTFGRQKLPRNAECLGSSIVEGATVRRPGPMAKRKSTPLMWRKWSLRKMGKGLLMPPESRGDCGDHRPLSGGIAMRKGSMPKSPGAWNEYPTLHRRRRIGRCDLSHTRSVAGSPRLELRDGCLRSSRAAKYAALSSFNPTAIGRCDAVFPGCHGNPSPEQPAGFYELKYTGTRMFLLCQPLGTTH